MGQIGWLVPTLLIGIVAFITTNIDNLLLLILLFSQPGYRKRHIVIGQYLGFLVIILVSTLGFFGKFLVPLAWIGLLGLIPIIIGASKIKGLFRKQIRKQVETSSSNKDIQPDMAPSFVRITVEPLLNAQTYRVALLAIGNGSDNISTYTPLFASENFVRLIFLISLFFLLIGIWCFLGYEVALIPAIAKVIEQYGNILLPFAYILLGLYIMSQSGTFLLLAQLVRLR